MHLNPEAKTYYVFGLEKPQQTRENITGLKPAIKNDLSGVKGVPDKAEGSFLGMMNNFEHQAA